MKGKGKLFDSFTEKREIYEQCWGKQRGKAFLDIFIMVLGKYIVSYSMSFIKEFGKERIALDTLVDHVTRQRHRHRWLQQLQLQQLLLL